jgi:hypothetical protein
VNSLVCGQAVLTTILTDVIVASGGSQITVPTSRVASMTLEAPAIVVAWQDTDTQIASLWQDILSAATTDNLYGPGYTGVACSSLGGILCPEPTTFSASSDEGSSSTTASIFARAGVRAGVGVGISVAVILIGALIALCFRKKKKQNKEKSEGDESSREESGHWAAGGIRDDIPKVPIIVTTEASYPSPSVQSAPVNDNPLPPLPQGEPQTNAVADTGSRDVSTASQELESTASNPVAPPDSSEEPSAIQSVSPSAGTPVVTSAPVSPVEPPVAEEAAATPSSLRSEQPTASDDILRRNDRLSRLQTLEEQATALQRQIAAERARIG